MSRVRSATTRIGVRPTRAEIAECVGKRVPDVLGPGLKVLFCGINPSLYSAAVGHHFARPGNRFWKALHAAGFTERLLRPEEDELLPSLGLGLTNVVDRATAPADEVPRASYAPGFRALERKVHEHRPLYVAFLGLTAYGLLRGKTKVQIGLQEERFGGSRVWALPNPSGLNAHYQVEQLAGHYGELARAAGYVSKRARV